MTSKNKLTGLFLGAGASYEAGMPLVCELTSELTNWLTLEKLRTLNESWRSAGGGYPDRVIDDFCVMLSRSDQSYESLLGFLEVQFSRHSPMSQQYHGLYAWLVDQILSEPESPRRKMLKYNTAEMLQAQAAGQWDKRTGEVLRRNLDDSLRILRDKSGPFKRRFPSDI